jgi:hypothetical protein
MNGVAIQEAIDEMPADSGFTADDQTPPEEMDFQAVSPRQRLALEAFCKGGTIGDAAKAANVSRQTLHRWRAKYPHFALAMSSWSSACLSTAESELAELASRAVGALSNAIDKGDSRSAMAVLRSLGVLRTYQPSAAREQSSSRAGEQEMNLLMQALAGAGTEQLSSGTGEQEKEEAAWSEQLSSGTGEQEKEEAAWSEQLNSGAGEQEKAEVVKPTKEEARPATYSGGAAAQQEARQTQRRDGRPAGVLQYENVTSEAAKGPKPAILAGKAGAAIKMACDSALQDVTECYQMLPGQNASPRAAALASCA